MSWLQGLLGLFGGIKTVIKKLFDYFRKKEIEEALVDKMKAESYEKKEEIEDKLDQVIEEVGRKHDAKKDTPVMPGDDLFG